MPLKHKEALAHVSNTKFWIMTTMWQRPFSLRFHLGSHLRSLRCTSEPKFRVPRIDWESSSLDIEIRFSGYKGRRNFQSSSLECTTSLREQMNAQGDMLRKKRLKIFIAVVDVIELEWGSGPGTVGSVRSQLVGAWIKVLPKELQIHYLRRRGKENIPGSW
jgi:hypothetical protein